MSRAYRVSVSESLRKVVKGSDHISTDIEMLEVLPKEDMAILLGSELEGLGFERDGEVLVRVQDGVRISIDPVCGKVTVGAEICEEVDLQKETHGWADEDFGRSGKKKAEEQLREEAKKSLERQADAKAEKLTQQATEQLEGVLRDLQCELDGAVNRVTVQALKQKAAQIGEIKEITEDPENGSMTIVLEV
jgi:hypothetical protein